MAINAQLVHFKHFQALNQTAMIKILKKHDKRTNLRYACTQRGEGLNEY